MMILISVNKRFRNQYYIFSLIDEVLAKVHIIMDVSHYCFETGCFTESSVLNSKGMYLLLIKLLLLLYRHTCLLFSRCKPVFQVLIFAIGLGQKTFLFSYAFCTLCNSLVWTPSFS